MDDVTLSAPERAHLTAAISVLFAGGAGGDEAWGQAVAAALNALVGTDGALVVLQRDGAASFYGDPLPGHIVRRYATAPAELAGPGRLPATRVWCCSAPPAEAVVLGGDPVQGVELPDGEYEAVGFTTEFGIPGTYARAACHLRRPSDRAETRHRLALLSLVLPAFAAAARARAFAAVPRAAMARLVDALDTGALLCSTTGDAFHTNAALTRLLADAGRGAGALRAAVGRASRAFASDGGVARVATSLSREVQLDGGRYAIRSALLTVDAPGVAPTVAVTVERVGATRRTPDDLRAGFGLTERELDVTRLIAAGRSNAEIAHSLGISSSTARHHTERVLDKLGASSRAGVSAIVHGPVDRA